MSVTTQRNLVSHTPKTIELRFKARPENLALTRLALAGLAESTGSPEDLIADFKLAVTEACTNAMRHGGEGCGEDDDIVVRFTIRGETLSIDVQDFGGGFDPESALAEPEPLRADGHGLGLHIIRELSDELRVRSGRSGSRVMFLRRSRHPSSTPRDGGADSQREPVARGRGFRPWRSRR